MRLVLFKSCLANGRPDAKGLPHKALSCAEYGVSGVVSGCAGDTAARVRAGATQEQSADGRFVMAPSGQRSHEEHLSE